MKKILFFLFLLLVFPLNVFASNEQYIFLKNTNNNFYYTYYLPVYAENVILTRQLNFTGDTSYFYLYSRSGGSVSSVYFTYNYSNTVTDPWFINRGSVNTFSFQSFEIIDNTFETYYEFDHLLSSSDLNLLFTDPESIPGIILPEPEQPDFDFEYSQYSNLLLLDPKIKGLILDAYSGAPSALISLIGYLDPVIGDEPLFKGLGSIVGYIMYPFAHSDYVSHKYDQMALGYYILTNQIVDGSSSTKPMNILKKGDKITAFGVEEQTITLPTSGAVDIGVVPVYYNQDTQTYVKGQMSVINNVTDNSVGDVIYADYSSVTINDTTYNQDLSNTYIEYITNDNSVTNNISSYTYITNVPGEGVPGQDPVVDDEVYAIFDGLEFKDLDNVLDDGNDFWVDMIKNTDLLHILGQIGALMLQFWYFLPLLLGWLAWLPAWATSCLLFCSIIIVLLGCIHALKGVIDT